MTGFQPNQFLAIQLRESIARVGELEEAIRKHKAAQGNDLCWENDLELWNVLPEGSGTYPHDSLPSREEFLSNCEKYYCSREIECRKLR